MKKVLITIVGIFIGYIICGFIMECMNDDRIDDDLSSEDEKRLFK